MWIRRRRGWELPERAATSEHVYFDRRRLLRALGVGGAILAAPLALRMGMSGDRAAPAPQVASSEPDPSSGLYPVPRDARYVLDRPLTEESHATSYNNFYEFGSHKQIAQAAQALPIRPWQVVLDGLVEQPITLDIDDLLRRMPLQERLYRHRCVEAWAMAVPWSGFPLAALVELARPLGSAKYLQMTTFDDPDVAPGQRQGWYPWPYVEGLTIAEATNELAFIATGLYGKPMPRQNGAPLRLAVPWKYGFKSIKSIVRFTFTEARPHTFWETIQPAEYGFWANVNPAVPHPRWSQASERLLGTGERVPTQLFNGYPAFVAHLYQGLERERLYA
jgi:methionine sulfoxide reductase catalytic subunit